MYKPVIVYGISEAIHEYVSNVIRFEQVEMEQVKVVNTNEFVTNYNRKITTAPVKRFVIDGENVYVAIHPHLEEIINCELKEDNQRLNRLLDQFSIDFDKVINDLDHYRERISNYNSLPWYKRLFTTV